MQRDELCPLLSVSEVMHLAANLKIGNQMTSDEKQQMVFYICYTIALKDLCFFSNSIFNTDSRNINSNGLATCRGHKNCASLGG